MKDKGNDYDNKEQKLAKTKQSKKTYQKPQLQVYGDLREITQTFAMKLAKWTAELARWTRPTPEDLSLYSLTGHGHMVTDKLRTDAYAQALEQDIKTGDVVAEIGTGTGIFALLACRFGARRVYAFEPSAVIELAREIATANGFADRIEFIPKMSLESALPERADVIVSDVHGVLPFFNRGLLSLIDARNRFLAPHGRMIPRSDSLWIAGVKSAELYQAHLGPWKDKPYDFEMSAALPRRVNSMDQCYVTAEDLFLEPRCLATIDYQTIQQPDLDASASWTVDHESQGHGIVLWFDSVLADSKTTN